VVSFSKVAKPFAVNSIWVIIGLPAHNIQNVHRFPMSQQSCGSCAPIGVPRASAFHLLESSRVIRTKL